MSEKPRKPRSVALETPGDDAEGAEPPRASRRPREIPDLEALELEPDSAAQDWPVEPVAAKPPARRRFPLLTMLAISVVGLVSLAAGLAVDRLVADLFARNTWLGWIAVVLASFAGLAVAALAIREILGFWRIGAIEALRGRAAEANRADDPEKAAKVIDELSRLYADRPDTARGRTRLAEHAGEVIDGRDLIALVERDLLLPLDARARQMVMDSAKRVSVVTAVSPRALVDLLFVLAENWRLIRRISELYGGRPGTLGLWRLSGRVISHLAATGAIAVGDSVIQQLIGHGLAARLSARLGEGVVNGLLTARIGIAAIDLCRPIEFTNVRRPGMRGFLSELTNIAGVKESADTASEGKTGDDPSPTGKNEAKPQSRH